MVLALPDGVGEPLRLESVMNWIKKVSSIGTYLPETVEEDDSLAVSEAISSSSRSSPPFRVSGVLDELTSLAAAAYASAVSPESLQFTISFHVHSVVPFSLTANSNPQPCHSDNASAHYNSNMQHPHSSH